jgi:hypothetical protein
MKRQATATAKATSNLACSECGAGLPPPNAAGESSCFYCGARHAQRESEIVPVSQETPARDRESSHDGEDAARIAMTEESVLQLLRQHFGDVEPIFLCPHVPQRKEAMVRHAHLVHLPETERILGLYDASWLGHGTDGFVVTSRRLCWKNVGEPACSITWRDVEPELLCVDRRHLSVSAVATIKIDDDALLEACANAFHVLALSALPPRPIRSGYIERGRTAPEGLAPPPATLAFPAYEPTDAESAPDRCCWHCRTPLFRSTPQCGYCGVLPKRRGWLRAS